MDQLHVVDLTPKFLDFYECAKDVDQERRWTLWKERYGFAAVPPGEQGEKLARELLDRAWPRYADVIPHLRTWKPDASRLEERLRQVKDLLGCGGDVELTVLFFVGCFDGNAFVAPTGGGGMALCLPVEEGESEITFTHELTHIVHGKTAGLSLAWERTVGTTILQEGLAMHASRVLVPGQPDEAYTCELTPNWLQSCRERWEEIRTGILPSLEDSTSETVYHFTIGPGTTGLGREAYYVGWRVVFQLLTRGMTFQEIAAIKEADMPETIRKALTE